MTVSDLLPQLQLTGDSPRQPTKMSAMKRLAITVATLAVLLTACGNGDPASPGSTGSERTIKVRMIDNEFDPGSLKLSKGETVRLEFTNGGSIRHEAIVGDEKAQAHHESEMGMKGDMHDESSAVSVEPGETKELTYKASKAGPTLIGCHEPGHYDAGMKVKVAVA